MLKVLVVEDDKNIRTLISKHLKINQFDVIEAEDGSIALAVFEHEHIDLVVTDILMPKVDGHQLTSRLRQISKNIPILMLTALDTYDDKERGFLSGVDDYMVKPIDFNEMLLRIKALLRRYEINLNRKIEFAHSCLDETTNTCKINESVIELTTKEFQILFKLLSYPNKIFTREQLMNEIWGYDSESYERTIDTHIKRIRENASSPDFEITTVRGLGYKAVLK